MPELSRLMRSDPGNLIDRSLAHAGSVDLTSTLDILNYLSKINSLDFGSKIWKKLSIRIFQANFSNWWLMYLLRNCPEEIITRPHWLVQAMAWCRQATSRYLSQCLHRFGISIITKHWNDTVLALKLFHVKVKEQLKPLSKHCFIFT